MMREIKFRAWIKPNNTGFEGEMITQESNSDWFMISNGTGFTIVEDHTDYLEEDQFVIMQYTGLKDKNGVEIYEGDIIAYTNLLEEEKKGSIYFREGSFRLKQKTLGKNEWDGEVRMWNDGSHDWYSIENLESFEMEVIGNIHQNPELLK